MLIYAYPPLEATTGWDPASGLGVVDFPKLLKAALKAGDDRNRRLRGPGLRGGAQLA